MPHFAFAVDSDMKNISDEQYLVLRIKETLKENANQSKAWTLTAKTLFPQNFDIQFEAYLIEKNSGNFKEAAKCFSTLFQSFVSEKGLWDEINALTNALRTESSSSDAVFLRNMFSYIPSMIQHDILTVTAEKSEDTMEHCRLMLLLFHKFPQTTPHLTVRLVETLMTAEKHGHCPNVINCYRKTLVCEVLPLLLHTTAELPMKQLNRFLHKSVEFYLAYLMSKSSTIENLLENEIKNDITWESLFNLLKMFGSKFDWELCSIFVHPWNREVAWQHIMTFSTIRITAIDPAKALRQLIYCLTILFAYCLYQYNTAINPGTENRHAAVLVEAFVVKESDEFLATPPKRSKLDSTDANIPLLTAGEGTGDIIKHFNFALKCWTTLNSTEAYQKEFIKLKQHIKLDTWLLDFIIDVSLFRGKFEEFQVNAYANNAGLRNGIQKLTCNFIMKNYHVLGECCIYVVKLLDALPVVGSYYPALTECGVLRHLHYLPITKVSVLQYVVKLLVIMYWHLLPNFTGFDIDRVYGYLLILCQMNWPSEKRIVFDVITRIRNQRKFTFSLFFKYVVNVEILEEFMHIYANEQDAIKLDLIGSNQPQSLKRMSTRGVDKGEREDFRHLMKQQVCRQEPLYILIIQFLLEEERFISLKQV